jgi:hypothetical protein
VLDKIDEVVSNVRLGAILAEEGVSVILRDPVRACPESTSSIMPTSMVMLDDPKAAVTVSQLVIALSTVDTVTLSVVLAGNGVSNVVRCKCVSEMVVVAVVVVVASMREVGLVSLRLLSKLGCISAAVVSSNDIVKALV